MLLFSSHALSNSGLTGNSRINNVLRRLWLKSNYLAVGFKQIATSSLLG